MHLSLAATLVPGFVSVITRSFLKSCHGKNEQHLPQLTRSVAAARELTFLFQQYPAIMPWCATVEAGVGQWNCRS